MRVQTVLGENILWSLKKILTSHYDFLKCTLFQVEKTVIKPNRKRALQISKCYSKQKGK